VERLGLRDGARKPVEDKALCRVRLGNALSNQLDHRRVADEGAGFHDRLDLAAQFAARGDRRAQHVAGGDLDDAIALFEAFCLGPLPGARRTQQDQVHQRRPRSRARRISPSYWCASRCEWICATVSIVTLTTMRRLVPPK